MGWLRLPESAHSVPGSVPLGDRADTFADYSLVGATLVYSSLISLSRENRNIVSEGYLLSDLAYARIRYDLKKSEAYPATFAFCRTILAKPPMKPDLYIVLLARDDTISKRQMDKDGRERNLDGFFSETYYSALTKIHEEMGESNVAKVFTDSDPRITLGAIMDKLREWKLTP